MKSIATLTMNPTIDIAYEVDRMVHTHKMRTLAEYHAPGGGGINVARVIARLGGDAHCYYLSGGVTGPALDGLIAMHRLKRTRIAIEGHTRIATNTLARDSGKEYRLVPAGPSIRPEEWRACLDIVAKADCEFFIASGSLPPDAPPDFYAQISALMRERGIAMVLDSSGEALRQGLAGGNVLLAKPSLGELRQIAGRKIETIDEISRAAMEIINAHHAEMLVVTLGHRGAVLVRREGVLALPAIDVVAKSAVGAGDSFLAAMVHALASGRDPIEAFRYGMAAGAAAVLTPGTGLAHPDDIERLFARVPAV